MTNGQLHRTLCLYAETLVNPLKGQILPMMKLTPLFLSTALLASVGIGRTQAQAPFAAPSFAPLYERISEDAENARWQWGTLRVQPSVGLGSLQYVNNTFVDADVDAEEIDDIQASVFGGLNFYQLVGDRSAFAISIKPSYSWWNELEDRRRLNLNAQASAALKSGRFFLDADAGRNEELGIATEEAAQLINYRSDIVDINTGFEIYRSLAFSVGYERTEREHLLDESPSALIPDFGRLDETTETLFAGIRMEPGRHATLQLGVIELETESPNTLRNFDGSGYQAELTYSTEVLEIGTQVRNVDLEPTGISDFVATDFTSGYLSVRLGSALGRSLTFVADRGLGASVRTALQDFESTRYGVLSRVPVGKRVALAASYRIGTRDFRQSPREDDTREATVGFDFALQNGIGLTARFVRSELDSTEAAFEREFDRFTVGLTVGLSGFVWP